MRQPGTTPAISVCIQTYQHANFIKDCLDSVISQQTNFPVEIIVGEDDSTDGTREICTEYAEKYPDIIRLFLRSEKDKVYINGKKTGRFNFISNLQEARGKYIALVDGDDYWCDNHKLQKQFQYMEAHPGISLSFHHVYRAWIKEKPFMPKRPRLPAEETILSIKDLVKWNIISSASCMFLRSNIDDIPPWFWEVPFLDYPLHIHSAQKGKIGFINETMSVYRLHPGGMWTSGSMMTHLKNYWQLYTILADHLGGDTGIAFMNRREEQGREIIRYLKGHRWEKRDWFREELAKNKFLHDTELMRLFRKSPGLIDFLRNGWNYTKKTILPSGKRIH